MIDDNHHEYAYTSANTNESTINYFRLIISLKRKLN